MKTSYLLQSLGLILLLLVASCKNDDDLSPIEPEDDIVCSEDKELGDIRLLESSLLFLPYSDSIRSVVFSDKDGNEVKGNITYNKTFSSATSLRDTFLCEQDTTQTYGVRYNTEARVVALKIEDIDVSIRFQLFLTVESGRRYGVIPSDTVLISDYFNVHLRTPIPDSTSVFELPNSILGIRVDDRTNPFRPITPASSAIYTLHGVDYFNVYYNSFNIQEGKFNMLYNSMFGLIGLENFDKTISLKYEYVE